MRALMVSATLIVACAPAASPPDATPTPAVAVSPSPTTSPTPAPSSTPALSRYTSAELGYSIELPAGWRRASCSSGIRSVSPLQAEEHLVNLGEADETNPVGVRYVLVRVEDSQGQTPLAWLEAATIGGGAVPLRYEPAQLDGRAGARAVDRGTGELVAWALAARGWIYSIEKLGPPGDPIVEAEAARMLPTLRIQSDATLGRGAPTPSPRTIEALADALADAFGRRDTIALGALLRECVVVGAAPGDAIYRARAGYLRDLRERFDAGTTVRVQARPIENDPAYGRSLRSTWSRPGEPEQRVDLLLRADGARWSLSGTLVRLR